MRAPRLVALAIPAVIALVALSVACIEIERVSEVDVTPGTVPEEIRGARWESFPLAYCVVSDESGFVPSDRLITLAADAFATWGVDVVSEGECDEADRGNDRNEISWGMADIEGVGAEDAGVFAAGFTFQRFRKCPGGCEGGGQARIVEADILVSPAPPEQFQTEECLFSTLLHEAGHFLGVPHLESPAVMAPATSECPQELTDADREALHELYGDAAVEG